MNTAARALAEATLTGYHFRDFVFSMRNFLISVLIVFLLTTAFGIVYTKDLNRRLFGELQALQQANETLSVEWGQLLLEQNTWSTASRIQKMAQTELDMSVPSSQTIVMMKP